MRHISLIESQQVGGGVHGDIQLHSSTVHQILNRAEGDATLAGILTAGGILAVFGPHNLAAAIWGAAVVAPWAIITAYQYSGAWNMLPTPASQTNY